MLTTRGTNCDNDVNMLTAATTDQQLLDATKLAAYASIGVAGATLLLAGFTAWLALSARRATKDTEKALDVVHRQAEALGVQADSARASLRASLKPRLNMNSQPRIAEEVGDTLTFEAGVHNVGPGVAVLGEVRLVLYGGEKRFAATGDWLAPQGDGSHRRSSTRGVSPMSCSRRLNSQSAPQVSVSSRFTTPTCSANSTRYSRWTAPARR
jgi:hypothetical protein